MANTRSLDWIVDREDWSRTELVEGPPPGEPAAGQVLFRVDRFAFTANNISYALAGDMLRYWDFFPAREGFGRIPTMGFGDVIASRHPEVAEGTRCFGFYPMSRYLVIEPSQVGSQIVDGAAHRHGLAPAYNQYSPTGSDALYQAGREDPLMLMRGLFMTSFLAEDFLQDSGLHGAQQILITSASSKTSIALAWLVSQRGAAKAVGLTSARNRAFVEGLGYYDEVRLYDEVEALDAAVPACLVDMAGDRAVNASLHHHFGERLVHHCNIGATHWDAGGFGAADEELPGARPEFFFAPGQIQKRLADWGPQGLQERLGGSWAAFSAASDAWLEVVRGYGAEAVERVYQDTLAGRTQPAQGHVISLWDSEAEASGRA